MKRYEPPAVIPVDGGSYEFCVVQDAAANRRPVYLTDAAEPKDSVVVQAMHKSNEAR